MEYSYRKSVFTKNQFFQLTKTSIKVFDEMKTLISIIGFNEIKSITITNTPTKYAPKMHQCIIKTNLNKKYILRNYSYQGFANFKDKNNNYLEFIEQLHHKVGGKDIIFKKGINYIGYISLITFLVLFTLVMFFITGILFYKNKFTEMILSGASVFLFIFLLYTSIKQFKPEIYNPKNIPKNALPI